MQKRVVYNFNAQTVAQAAAVHANGKAVKASNAIGRIKRAFSGKSLKLALFVVLLFASLFCTIGSADWIISQQKNVPNVTDSSIFKFDDLGFGAHVNNGNPTGSYVFNGNSIKVSMSATASGGAQTLPDDAVKAESIKYKVKKCDFGTDPATLDEKFFDGIEDTIELPKDAGTYAVLITSTVKDASSGKTISYGKAIKVFTIAPCPVNIEWSGAVGFIYDGADHIDNITATAKTADRTVISGIVDISYSYATEPGATASTVTEVKNAGTYTATAVITNDNYVLAEGGKTEFKVLQKELTVKAENKTVIYGESAPGYTATYTGLLDCDNGKLGTPAFKCAYTTKSPVDDYTIEVSGLANSNYHISYETGTLTVTQRTVTLNWGTTNSFVYNGNAQTLTPTAQNVVNNDNLGLTVTVTGEKITGSSAINAGTYTATASITNENYVIDENSKSATFTITARALTITANDHEIIYGSAPATNGYTISGIIEGETPETANINGTVKLTTNYTQFKDVGEYDIFVDISGLSSPNYSFKAVNGILTVNKKELTVTAKPHQITYGDEPSANGYTISGFVNNDNESVINGLENLTYIIDYAQWQDIGQFSITPKVDGLSAVNYSFKAKDGYLTVNKLDIQLSGIIERDYESGGIPYNKDLFSEATFTAPQNPGIDLKKLPYDIYQYISNAGNAQNFDSTNGLDITAENGLFSYKFGEAIKAGSTYKIDSVTLNNKNLKLTKTEVYLKYQTAIIGTGTNAQFFTIEDALAQSGNITLCGNASTASASSYVITAFAKLNNLSGTDFRNYNTSYEYTLKSNSTLLLPYNKDGLATNADSDIINCNSAPEYVYSVLAISQGIKFTISGTLDIGGRLSSKGGDLEQARVKQHSVVYNNGNIVVTNRINSYGYLKGANDGLVELQSTATALDIMRVYDWLAGTEAIQIHNAGIFPFKSYSIHNISCKTKIIKGAQYLAKAALNVQNTLLPSNPIPIVGASGSMFTVESGYILKTASNADSNKASTDLTSITGTNQLKGQKDIITLGDNTVCHDNSITLTIKMAGFTKEITTSKDYPLPISYFNLVVPSSATLNLNAVSYIFYPGSSLKVEAGGNLKVEKVSVAFYTLNDCITDENWEKNRVKYATAEGTNDYAVDRTDAKLSIDAGGTATITSNASISGYITATNAQAQLIINASTSVTVKVPTDLIAHNVASDIDKGLIAAGITKASKTTKTYTAFGDIMTKQNNHSQQDFSTVTYYSANIGSAYAWFKNSATITYNPNGGTLNGNTTETVTLPSGGYTSLPTPTRKYYSFDGWYFDVALTQKATAIYTDCTLYAKWTEEEYTIIFNIPDGFGKYDSIKLYGEHTYNLPTLDTVTKDGQEFTFGGWYLNPDYLGEPITTVSAATIADNSKIINVYALFYRVGTYTVKYEENPGNITFANNLTVTKQESQIFNKGVSVSQSELRSLKEYNENTSFDYYFEGWYLSTDSNKTIIKSLPKTIDGDIILCAKWIKKAQLKIEMPVFENGNRTGNTIVYDTHKYFYKQTIKEIGINNLSSYIGAVYTVPESYKFIGFNASSGFTAKQNYSNMNNITTAIEVGETSNDLTITADIRKILRVDITMSASAKFVHNGLFGSKENTKEFEIKSISISDSSMYSTNKSDWLISNGTTDLKQKTTGTQTFYVLEGTTALTITIDGFRLKAGIGSGDFTAADILIYEATGCTKPANNSPFAFTITNSDVTINWSGEVKKSD